LFVGGTSLARRQAMKKSTSKLALKRHTIQRLQPDELAQVNGGSLSVYNPSGGITSLNPSGGITSLSGGR
jgi:hypothetical protein